MAKLQAPLHWSDPFFTPREHILVVIHGPFPSTEALPSFEFRPQIPQVVARAVAIPGT